MSSRLLVLLITALAICPIGGFSQQKVVQRVKGQIVDKSIRLPLEGASIVITDVSGFDAISMADGRFRLDGIPVGRHAIEITHVGYKPLRLGNILVESGKQLELNVEMEADVSLSKEIVIKSKPSKGKPLNDLAMVSGRMFSVEETRRFAAGLNDPSRIASSYAGVAAAGDGNALIIRGNAPNGLLWRMEGVDIPNPNHFARVGTSGGAISILSAQLLSNSDFLTGAFPAEYGNALSGVFDIRLRKGNRDRREHTFSMSTIGVDFATEGYFKKGYGGSYLINYRYGFLTLMQKLGFDISDAATSFQDLSFNIYLPTRKVGSFSVFGFGGLSRQDDYLAGDSLTWLQDPSKRSGSVDGANTATAGISHQLNIGKKTLWKTVASLNGYSYIEQDKRLDRFSSPVVFTRNNRFAENNLILSSVMTHKFNVHHLIKVGGYATVKSFDLNQREFASNALRDKVRADGRATLANGFLQWKWDPISRFSLQLGLHAQYFDLNQKSDIGPRFGFKFMTTKGQYLSFGMGYHSQIQALGTYFARVKIGNDTLMPNNQLDFSRARHFVLGYTIPFAQNWNLRSEAYYQWLTGIPVHANRQSSYSVINQEDNFVIDALNNEGKGQNYGLELTLDRFWNDRFYLLGTLSLYQSTYLPSEKIWRNTRYNSNSSFTLLAGKEWEFKRKRTSSLGIDLKLISGGGVRATTIDLVKSQQQRTTILIPGLIYAEKMKPIFRIDAQLEWKVQYARKTGSFILGVQNATNRKNQINRRYNADLGRITYSYLLGRIPVFGYRLDL